MHPKVSCLQMTSVNNIQTNLDTAKKLLQQAAGEGARMAVLPEMFPTLSVENGHIEAREHYGKGPIQDFLAEHAKALNLWIVAGTIPIASEDNQRVHAACLVYNHEGEVVARYNKIHLCDIKLHKGSQCYHESMKTIPGNEPVVFESPIGMVGLAVCYDLRFPELFRILVDKGAETIILPSAFISSTGEAHWEVLCRARAIETQCYVVAANQTGEHSGGRKSFGHSMIIDPWGKILACETTDEGIVTAGIDFDYVQTVRESVPIQSHRRL